MKAVKMLRNIWQRIWRMKVSVLLNISMEKMHQFSQRTLPMPWVTVH